MESKDVVKADVEEGCGEDDELIDHQESLELEGVEGKMSLVERSLKVQQVRMVLD